MFIQYIKIDYTHLSLTLDTQPGWEWRKAAVRLDFTVFSEDGGLEMISKEFFQGDLFTRFEIGYISTQLLYGCWLIALLYDNEKALTAAS